MWKSMLQISGRISTTSAIWASEIAVLLAFEDELGMIESVDGMMRLGKSW